MIHIDKLNIIVEFPQELNKHSCDLVGYVIVKYSKKVIKTNVLTRASLPQWYEAVKLRYAPDKHIFIVATVSLIGVVLGMQTEEDYTEKEKPEVADNQDDYGVWQDNKNTN